MDNKEQIINAIMASSATFVAGVLDFVYRESTKLSVENEYGRMMINTDLLKELIELAKENVGKVANG